MSATQANDASNAGRPAEVTRSQKATQNLEPEVRDFYCRCLDILRGAGVPFMVGGAYALERYTGISRHTKDFDVFLKRGDLDRALQALSDAGCRTEVTMDHWLAKAYRSEADDTFIDLIFASGNGVSSVDDSWLSHAVPQEVLGVEALILPPEKIILTKAFVMERERYDGADIAHLVLHSARDMDWQHLVDSFGPHWRVLLSHLVLFGFVYPSERALIPQEIMQQLLARVGEELISTPPAGRICFGPLVSREQYLIDINEWGYKDARQEPVGNMSKEDIEVMTEDIANKDKYH